MRFRTGFLLFIAVFILWPRTVLAVQAPNYSSCPQLQAQTPSVKNSGVHGIVGVSQSYSGTDSVYFQGSDANQCFCGNDGQGIQTYWWKISELDEQTVSYFTNSGWVYVPSGLPWGLDDSPYLTKNSSYTCFEGGIGGGDQGSNSSGGADNGAAACSQPTPDTPQLLSVQRISQKTVRLSWTAVKNATTYSISYGTKAGTYQYGVPSTGNLTTFTVSSLDPDTKYYFSVRAINSCAPGQQSNELSNQISDGIGGGDILGVTNDNAGQVLGIATSGINQRLLIAILFSAIFGVAAIFLPAKNRDH